MFVLVDVQWVVLKGGRSAPTQLAAIRVDAGWSPVDQFHTLIRPLDQSFHLWSDVAYDGASRSAFVAAPTADKALRNFTGWLREDDVLLFWLEACMTRLGRLQQSLCGTALKQACYALQPQFAHLVHDGLSTKGTLLYLCQLRGIPTPAPRHAAVNMVEILRQLLLQVDFPTEHLLPERCADGLLPAALCRSAYWLDTSCWTVHAAGCSMVSPGQPVQGLDVLNRTLIRTGRRMIHPCPQCCKAAWHDALMARNQHIIAAAPYTYFFIPGSRVFHTRSCPVLRRTTRALNGAKYFQTCLSSGFAPCKLCRPVSTGDRPSRPPHRRPARPVRPKAPLTVAPPCRRPTRLERRALRRHQEAVNDRLEMDLSSMSPQEKKDARTLTNPGFAFWAATGYQSFHLRSCSRLKGLSELRGFARFGDAQRAGYRPCRYCKPTPEQDMIFSVPFRNHQRENESVSGLISQCEAHGFSCEVGKKELTIITPAARWSFDPQLRPIRLMHQPTGDPSPGQHSRHRQPRVFLSMQDVLAYIVRHDKR